MFSTNFRRIAFVAILISAGLAFSASTALANDSEGDGRGNDRYRSGHGACAGLPSTNPNYTPIDGWAHHPKRYAHLRACYEQTMCEARGGRFCLQPEIYGDD